jgi:putative ABC transport system permease protein
MMTFLFKGLIRDRSRSLLPVLVVTAGAFLVVFLYCWVQGARNDILWSNAAFDTGHVKITTKAYAEDTDLLPNDLALMGVDSLLAALRQSYPTMTWTSRTRFGGLLDIPDQNGETRVQAPIIGLAVNLSSGSPEYQILNMAPALVQGALPIQHDDLLISDLLAQQLGLKIGETATLISSTMYGSMTMHNFRIAGTVHFGIMGMDRGAVIADESEVRAMLDMEDASAEIVGYFPDFLYHEQKAEEIANAFNTRQPAQGDFSPQMVTLGQQNDLEGMLVIFRAFSSIIISVFIFAMSIVLWNTGLMGILRRYGEIGVRLAIGESKGHVYKSMLGESLLIGIFGAAMGTALGLAASYYMQVKGIDITSAAQNSSMLLSNVIRAQVTPVAFYIGLIPAIIAPQLGALISGFGIYKRQTAQLFKELEV